MYGRTPYEAIQNFRSTLQRVVSCITDSVIVVRGSEYGPGSEHFLSLGSGGPIKQSGVDIALWIRHFARVVEHDASRTPWRAETIGYLYSLLEDKGQEIISYQWHPNQQSPITTPHLHLGAGANIGRAELQKAHIPTGLIDLEDVLLLAIREFGATPRRDDWALILGRA